MPKKPEQIVETYTKEKTKYLDFSKSIKGILAQILEKGGYTYQQITYRAKDEDSLLEKLRKKNYKSVKDCTDLAGCRVIFYLESDIQKFVQFLRNEFFVKEESLKYEEKGYNARHLIVKLKEKRAKTPEYSQFKGLFCEIQLTTVLFHAWSEPEHNILYKPQRELKEFDETAFNTLEEDFNNIMKKHIWPATIEFEAIFKRLNDLRQARKILSLDYFKDTLALSNNNEIYTNLEQIYKSLSVHPNKAPEGLNIIQFIKEVEKKSRKIKTIDIGYFLGKIKGKKTQDIVIICLKIATIVFHSSPSESLKYILKKTKNSNSSIKKESLEKIRDLSKYNFFLIQKTGYFYYKNLLGNVQLWTNKGFKNKEEVVIAVCLNLLGNSREGIRNIDPLKLEIINAPIWINKDLKEIREKSLDLLKLLYKEVNDPKIKLRIIEGFSEAVRFPMNIPYDSNFKSFILNDFNKLIEIYTNLIPDSNFPEIKEIENHLGLFLRKFKGSRFVSNARKLKSIIDKNNEYQFYKILVGNKNFNSFYPTKLERLTSFRLNKIKTYVKSINLRNIKEWVDRILNITSFKDFIDIDQFYYFKQFLYEIGKEKPSLAVDLLKKSELENFYVNLLSGLWSSNKNRKVAIEVINDYLKKKKKLEILPFVFRSNKRTHIPLIQNVVKEMIVQKDFFALKLMVGTIFFLYKNQKSFVSIFSQILIFLNSHKEPLSSDQFILHDEIFLGQLNEKTLHLLLDNLVYVNNIDYFLQEFLKFFAKQNPENVINFFKKRLDFETVQRNRRNLYNAVPYEIGGLINFFQKKAEEIISLIFSWFPRKNAFIRFKYAHFIKDIFPAGHNFMNICLIRMIDNDMLNNVFDVLDVYGGNVQFDKVYQNLIKKKPNNKKFIADICQLYSKVSDCNYAVGEHIKAYQKLKEHVQNWPEEKDLLLFKNKFSMLIDEMIAEESRRLSRDNKLRQKGIAPV